jgi:hypothetical protein
MREGDPATVDPIDTDPYILQFRRHVWIEKVVDGGYLVRLDSVAQGLEVLGPIPADRVRPGWIEADGRVRT